VAERPRSKARAQLLRRKHRSRKGRSMNAMSFVADDRVVPAPADLPIGRRFCNTSLGPMTIRATRELLASNTAVAGNAPRPVELRVAATACSDSYATFFSGATATVGRIAATSEG